MPQTTFANRGLSFDAIHRAAFERLVAERGADSVARRIGYTRQLIGAVYAGRRNVSPGLVWELQRHGLMTAEQGAKDRATDGAPAPAALPALDLDGDKDVDRDDLALARVLRSHAAVVEQQIAEQCGLGGV